MKPRKIWHTPEYDAADARAVQTLMTYAHEAEMPSEPGQAPPAPSPQDCKRVLDWIIHQASATYENGFVPDDANGRIGAFMEGRRFVGQQIIKLGKIKIGAVFYGQQRDYAEDG